VASSKNRALLRRQYPSIFFQNTRMKIGCFLTLKNPRTAIFIHPKKLPKWKSVLMEIESY
jgi:hypothetical protein